jgi:DNA-binding transcriptional ArsR family regulator
MDVRREINANSIVRVAGLIGEPGRIRILATLLDGNSHSAGELATAADLSAQSASIHLAKLLSAGLIIREQRGRLHQYRLKSSDVARAIEALGALAPDAIAPAMSDIRFARTCYDHLAGVLAIALRNQLLERDSVRMQEDGFVLTDRGETLLGGLGINAQMLYGRRRAFAHKCLDWTERHHHIGGALGAALLSKFFEMDWLARMRNTRAVRVTEEGERALEHRFGVRCAQVRNTAPLARPRSRGRRN